MAIELPNGKISLTLPEQVGHNAKNISKIFQLLDGLNVQDNVVVLDDISHVLTAQEITVLQQAVAFIVYNGHLYIKSGESGTDAYFDIVFSITPPGTAITFSSSVITANLSNGALSVASSSVNAYSTTQIDSLLSAKADITYVDGNFAALSGANFTGPITSPSIIEDMPSGYGFTPNNTDPALTFEFVYVGAVKTGNKLTCVMAFNVTKTGTVLDNDGRIGNFNIPSAVGAKLIPTQIGAYYFLNNKVEHAFSSGSSNVQATCFSEKINNTTFANKVRVDNLVLNTKYYVRYEITFLLSDSLAS